MVRTRIAPSPTGEDLHIGNLYTALINYVIARKNKGQFIIRIEDTDRMRFVEGSERRILETIKEYGLHFDEGPDKGGEYGPYRQSERLEIYKKYANELIQKKQAYYCFCTKERLDELREKQQQEKKIPRYDKHCLHTVENADERIKNGEAYVIRLNVLPDQKIYFTDVIRGEIEFNSNNIDDQVLIKSDGYPTYHMAVVVDDYLMKISHVIRAEEWISSTPKHVILYNAFGWELPVFAHIPILRNPDKSKLSKRKNPVWASWYIEQGYLQEAVLNYLSLMGWSHPEEKEIFDLDEFISVFDLKDMHAVGPVFDLAKLKWMNSVYIRNLTDNELEQKIVNFIGTMYSKEVVHKTIPLIKERISILSEYVPLCEFFFHAPTTYELPLSDKKIMFGKLVDSLKTVEKWDANTLGEVMQNVARQIGMKNREFFMSVRVAITGKTVTPPLNESMEILGKNEVISRLTKVS